MGRGDDTPGSPAGVESIVVLGRLTGAYGVRGWVRIQPSGDDPLAWGTIDTWWIGRAREKAATPLWQPYSLLQCRLHGNEVVARLEGVEDRDAAEELKGALLGIVRADLPEPEEGAYYWGDLIGMRVTGYGGTKLGTVDRLLETGANDVLVVVDDEGKERLLPFVEAVIGRVDRELRLIEALWDPEW